MMLMFEKGPKSMKTDRLQTRAGTSTGAQAHNGTHNFG